MSSIADLNLLVSLGDIAKLADVSASAVSNWRKRYEDFPSPRLDSGSGSLFDLGEVEAWLISRGRIKAPVQYVDIFDNLMGALRSWVTPLDISRFATSALVYFEACRRAFEQPRPVKMDLQWRWESFSQASDEELLRRLAEAATSIEGANPDLVSLLTTGLDCLDVVPAKAAADFLRVLHASVGADQDGGVNLYEKVTAWRDSFDRFLTQSSTPGDLAEIMARLAAGLGPRVFDPAAGDGGVLLSTAVRPLVDPYDVDEEGRADEEQRREFVAFDLTEEALRQCRSRFFLYNEELTWRLTNSLSDASVADVEADVVVLDPPYKLKNWADAALYRDPRWTYGAPPFSSADFAWLQVALSALRPGGVALVILPTSSLLSEGREGEIRRHLLAGGVVEAAVQLPPRLRRDTTIPLVLWVLRRRDPQRPAPDDVLFIDASMLGKPSREQHLLDEADVDTIVDLVSARLGGFITVSAGVEVEEIPLADVEDGNLLRAFKACREEQINVDELRDRRVQLIDRLGRHRSEAGALLDELIERIEANL